jgi:TP901-1 family phage major tail protein
MPSTGVNNATLIGVYISGTLISKGTGHTLSIGQDVFEITSKDSNGWKEIKPGLRNWSISGEFRFAEDATYGFDDLFAVLDGRTSVAIKFTSNTSQDDYYHGTAYLTSLEMSAEMEDAQGFSATFEGSGALTESLLT